MKTLFQALLFSLLSLSSFAFNVTFQLDLQEASGFTIPEVNGTFNNWCGSCNPMSDPNNDGIWEATINLSAGNYEYKFSFDTWTGQEELHAGMTCTQTAGQFTNRILAVTADVVLPVVCWASCSACNSLEDVNWGLVWSDEFEGNALNTSVWTYQIGGGGWGNNEWQYYTANGDNCEVSNGSLKITAIEEAVGNNLYTSSRLITNNNYEFQYGRVEARIKVPLGQGIWPAFWMLGANFEDVGWPLCGEIDIMEHINNESVAYGTIHWLNGSHQYQGTNLPIDPSDFHTYGIVWDAEGIDWFIDDMIYYSFVFNSNNNTEQIFQNPFFFLLNVAVGGNWPGYPDNSTPFPVTMEVDFVRVYQEIITGVEELTLNNEPFINPSNALFWEPAKNQPLIILDAQGKQLAAFNHYVPGSFSFSGLPNGLYILQSNNQAAKIMISQ